MNASTSLVSTAQLAAMLGEDDLRIYDCTTYLEPAPQDSDAPYLVVPGRLSPESSCAGLTRASIENESSQDDGLPGQAWQ